jgi:hypothetical protein
MELKDILLAPVFLIIIYVVFFMLRDKLSTRETRKFFLPALSLKLFGSVFFGLIYQFYYRGGDTFNYYKQSKVVYNAFLTSPISGIKLFLNGGEFDPNLLDYISRMYWFDSPSEYAVIKFSAFFSLFCFNTYTVISLFFASFSFLGLWALYNTFLKLYPKLYKEFALAIFFIPSLFFWGSGLMKDTLCIGMLGVLFYSFYNLAISKTNIPVNIFLIVFSFFVLKTIKIYILLAFLPPALFWVFLEYRKRIKNIAIRVLLGPLLLLCGAYMAYYGATTITRGNANYDLEKLAKRTKVNADYLYSVSKKQEGSAYSIGSLDGTLSGMVKLTPQAVNVALFRPYVWEVRNPLMLLSALEAMYFLLLTIYILFNVGFFKSIKLILVKPILTMCFVFSIIFAFAVGINSFNFGTLVRYKIPLIPFYLCGLYILKTYKHKRAVTHSVNFSRGLSISNN